MSRKVRIPYFPIYSRAQALLEAIEGVKRDELTHMIGRIKDQTGTPQNPVSWTEPEKWIPERLKGRDRELALLIWNKTEQVVNPRHIAGSYILINKYQLVTLNTKGCFQTTDRGKGFIKNEDRILRDLDGSEGLLKILSILSTKDKAKHGDLLPEWREYLSEVSNFQSKSTHKATLRRRIANLIERRLIKAQSNTYSLSPEGLTYLESTDFLSSDPKRDALQALKAFNNEQRIALKAKLAEMDPYDFEYLVLALLETMGYEDVVVTKQAGDKGVDVIADIQFGITSIREVVQVKRTPNSTLGRPIVDQLRGALHYHQAIQGTIITLGKVGRGAREAAIFQGAAPITLIDGERLLDLLIEHEVGVKKNQVSIWEVDGDFFCQREELSDD